jgi:hypothetical protein
MKPLERLRLLSALSLLCCGPALAATIYKSVDANGVVSFSDTRPEHAVLVETVVIDVQEPSSEVTQQRLQDMRETTDRMVADRIARERHRAEMRQLDAQATAQHRSQEPPQDLTDYYTSPVIFSGYSPFPARRQWRHPNHPRPEHPIARPPLLPPGLHRPSTRPLPSHDYPASLVRRHYDPKVRASLDKQ